MTALNLNVYKPIDNQFLILNFNKNHNEKNRTNINHYFCD